MASTIEQRRSRRGIDRLERRWVPDGPPVAAVALVHGINEHSGRYEHVGDALAAAGIDTAAFDLPGHGGSGGRRGHIDHFDQLLDEVEELIEERRSLAVPVVLLGHSLGGLIVVAYAESDRAQPDLLAVSAPALITSTPQLLRRAAWVLSRVAPRFAVPNDFDASRLTRDADRARAYAEDPLRVTRTTARLGQEIFAAQAVALAGVERIRVPVWVVHGGADSIVPVAASEPLGRLPDAVRTVHPDLRHECFNEPEWREVVGDLTAWIRDRV